MTIYLAMSVACAALAVLFFLGKGTFLVRGTDAGSDMAEFFDDRRLRIVCGSGMVLMALLYALSAVFLQRILFWLPMLIGAVICAVLVLLCNTVCALPQPEPWYRRTAGMFFLGLCVVSIFALTLFGKSASIDVTADADSFTVRGSFGFTRTVEYTAVQDVTLETGWENGTRLRGTAGNRFCEGKFRNDTAGIYTMFAYTQCDARVMIRTDTGILVLNAPTAEKTKAIYDMLAERVKNDAAQ